MNWFEEALAALFTDTRVHTPPAFVFSRRHIEAFAKWFGLSPEEFKRKHNVVEAPPLPAHLPKEDTND